MTYVRDGDELVVSSIDRLARSLTDLRGIVDELTGKGVTVTFLHENLIFAKGTTDPRAELMLGILGSFAEFEWAIIRERQAEGVKSVEVVYLFFLNRGTVSSVVLGAGSGLMSVH